MLELLSNDMSVNMGPRRKANLEILSISEPLCVNGSNLCDIIYRVNQDLKADIEQNAISGDGIILWWGHKYIKLHEVQGNVEDIELIR